MPKALEVKGVDLKLSELQPRNIRKPGKREFERLIATIRAVGLIEPLCVHKEGSKYIILDGYLRYLACIQLQIESVPCLVYKNKESYTYNRMVSKLSPVQEYRMVMKSRTHLDDATLATTFGMKSLKPRLNKTFQERLHPAVLKAVDANKMTVNCAETLARVKPERQKEILDEMNRTGDFGPAFARALVVQTPVRLRNKVTGAMNPWKSENSDELNIKFLRVQERFDFYTKLYRDYVSDFLKTTVYLRKWLANERVNAYLAAKRPDVLAVLQGIIFEVDQDASSPAQTAALTRK